MRKSARIVVVLLALITVLATASTAMAGPFGPIVYMRARSPYGPYGPIVWYSTMHDFDRLPTGVQLPLELRNMFW